MTRRTYKVLSLEDSPQDFEIMHYKLTETGFSLEIDNVDNKKDFISLLSSEHYDIILSDFRLSGFDGFEALRYCREICPDIPFICVSGYIGEETAIDLLKQGAVDYVLKEKLDRLPIAFNRALEEANERRERRKAQQELQESEARLKDLIFTLGDWVWEVDENGHYTYTSDSGTELLGYSAQEILGKTPFSFMPEDEAARIGKIFVGIAAGKELIVDLENWNISKNGERVCLLTNGVPVLDELGNLKGYRGVDKDITEKKLALEALKRSEANLNQAQQIARMGNWDMSFISNKYTWSENMYKMLDMDKNSGNVTFEHFFNLVHPDDRHLVDKYLNLINEKKTPVSYDFRYLLPKGQILWVQNDIIPVFEGDRLIELHGTNIDLTEKKQAELELIKAKEKAEKSDGLKTAFINNISHEVRTPLNGILGFSEMLITKDITEENKVLFQEIIRKSSNRLLKTITSYMDISMIVSGNMEKFIKEFKVIDLLDDLYSEYLELCSEKNLKLNIDAPSGSKGIWLSTDPDILRNILSYLVDNALKFTTHGSITFGFKQEARNLMFFVTDTGIGIDPDKIDMIFDYFMQADTSLTRGYEGSGLGLSIAGGLVKLLGGELKVRSKKGEGSSFFFSLPSTTIIAGFPVTPGFNKSVPVIEGSPLILVAEDDDYNYKFVELSLLDAGFRVLRVANGKDAVDSCRENRNLSLVLMDMKMPEMGGAEATRMIRTFLPDIPIIALTAYVSGKDESEALKSGCNSFLPKPIHGDKLIHEILKYISVK